MKNKYFYSCIFSITFLLFFSCNQKKEAALIPEYIVSVAATNKENAPALQSFSHGISGAEWLLFAGRTNQENDNGGLHDMTPKSDYANESFPPVSYNEKLYVYNPSTDAVATSISIEEMKKIISEKFKSYQKDTIKKYESAFKNTNAVVKQVNEYLFVIGGYGPIDFKKPKTTNYETYNHVVRIHVPSMIQLIKGNYDAVDESKLLAFGEHKSLVSTGGEMYYIGGDNIEKGKFYLVGGHNFGETAVNGQKYLDAVYPFSIGPKIVEKDTIKYGLGISVGTAISDVSDPNGASSDDNSIFRRRDGPITPSLYYNSLDKKVEESIAIYTGVFKPGEDLQAWNDAIYVHPNWAGKNNKLYTYDKAYNQKNYNVYSCPNIVAFDAKNKTLHTFLLGGIGDGNTTKETRLSGFTNTGTHIQLNVDEKPMQSSSNTFSHNLFGNNQTENTAPFYGAEAIMFPSSDFTSTAVSKEIIDLESSFNANKKTIEVGYIFGGIEAFVSHPGTYGKTKSRASNKIWKVTLTKQTIN